MPTIEFMTPVPPVPGATGFAVPRVLMLVPDQQGGIRRLFEQMQNASVGPTQTNLVFFASNDSRRMAMARFPGRLRSFRRKLTADGVDLCHINLSTGGSTVRKILFALMCRQAGVPYVLHLHGGRYPSFLGNAPAPLKAGIRWLFSNAERVVVLGRVWRQFVVSELNVDSDRVVILANAVEGQQAEHTRDSRARILLLGRVGRDKGVPELLDALATPEMSSLEWTATIAGDGEVELYRRRAKELGLNERIDFPGWVDGEQVAALLQAANILVLPSHVENLPLSMLEGMGHGLCPVVTPVGAVEDVIRDGENGLLVPVGDAGALAEALARVCSDGALRHRLASQARADFLAHYDISDYRARLEAIYLDVIKPGAVGE